MADQPIHRKTRTVSVEHASKLIRALTTAFAESLEAFSMEILGMLNDDDTAVAGRESAETDRHGALPGWVLEARARAKASEPVSTSPAELWERLVRNRFLVALKKQNMTQSALAKKLGKPDSQISRILAKPEVRQLSTLKEMADAIGVDLGDILRSEPSNE